MGFGNERNFEPLGNSADKAVYGALMLLLALYSVVITFSEALVPCEMLPREPGGFDARNPDVNLRACMHTRYSSLLGLSPEECDWGRRMLLACLMGSLIGYERRSADRPAGIRTMTLASLGACSFTIASWAGFRDGTMEWDASRVAAAIPSGVGFLGAGLIWKGSVGSGGTYQVRGLTTAASIWISASVGVCMGGGLYFPGCFCTVMVMAVLKFGPRMHDCDQDDEGMGVGEGCGSGSTGEAGSAGARARASASASLKAPRTAEPLLQSYGSIQGQAASSSHVRAAARRPGAFGGISPRSLSKSKSLYRD